MPPLAGYDSSAKGASIFDNGRRLWPAEMMSSHTKALRLVPFLTVTSFLLLFAEVYVTNTLLNVKSFNCGTLPSQVPVAWKMEHGSCSENKFVVIVCVCFLPIHSGHQVGRTSRGHTGGRSHRISHPPSFCGACLNFSREKVSAIPFPRRP